MGRVSLAQPARRDILGRLARLVSAIEAHGASPDRLGCREVAE